MSDILDNLMAELNKSKADFDEATTCVVHIVQTMCESLERVEKWITENQKSPQKNEI